MGAHLPHAYPQGGNCSVPGLISLLLRDNHCAHDITYAVGSCPGNFSPNCVSAVLIFWTFLYIINCGRAVLIVFRLFSEWVALYIVEVLMCLWEKVNSGSIYFSIFPNLNHHNFILHSNDWFNSAHAMTKEMWGDLGNLLEIN